MQCIYTAGRIVTADGVQPERITAESRVVVTGGVIV
jgi:hypothetical protein